MAETMTEGETVMAAEMSIEKLCYLLTQGAGPYAGQPLIRSEPGRPQFIGTGVENTTYCPWCGAIRQADDKHSADCPWLIVLDIANLGVTADDD